MTIRQMFEEFSGKLPESFVLPGNLPNPANNAYAGLVAYLKFSSFDQKELERLHGVFAQRPDYPAIVERIARENASICKNVLCDFARRRDSGLPPEILRKCVSLDWKIDLCAVRLMDEIANEMREDVAKNVDSLLQKAFSTHMPQFVMLVDPDRSGNVFFTSYLNFDAPKYLYSKGVYHLTREMLDKHDLRKTLFAAIRKNFPVLASTWFSN